MWEKKWIWKCTCVALPWLYGSWKSSSRPLWPWVQEEAGIENWLITNGWIDWIKETHYLNEHLLTFSVGSIWTSTLYNRVLLGVWCGINVPNSYTFTVLMSRNSVIQHHNCAECSLHAARCSTSWVNTLCAIDVVTLRGQSFPIQSYLASPTLSSLSNETS